MRNTFRGIAQLVEQRSPKPRVESSSLSAPAKNATQTGGVFISGRGRKARNERPSRRPQRGLETGSSVPVAHCVRERRAGPSALAGEGLPKTPPKRVAFLFQAGAERRETNARLLPDASQSSRPAGREAGVIHFSRRRVRREKFSARRECVFVRRLHENARVGAKPIHQKGIALLMNAAPPKRVAFLFSGRGRKACYAYVFVHI